MNKCRQEIIQLAKPLRDKESLALLLENLKGKKIVMIGEASHGTKEFYEWRQYITQELIREHGFNFIAVEGDWPPCQKINRYIKSKENWNEHEALAVFNRWPTWMWANTEILWFIAQLKEWNGNNISKQVGFHGLDIYSLFESMNQVLRILREKHPKLAREIGKKYACLEMHQYNEKEYAKSLLRSPIGCKNEVLDALNLALRGRLNGDVDDETWQDVLQNAQIVKNAENYYRAMVFGEEDSWNVRDEHMMETLRSLLNHYGPNSKGIVWEHNTHIGDYRATDMVSNGQINIGGLAREIYGKENVGLVGFGSYVGTVTASYSWDGPTMTFNIPEAKVGSVEQICHSVISEVGSSDFFMIFETSKMDSQLNAIRGHRAIGVVYDPRNEERRNYVPTSLANRYDIFIFINRTNALVPLNINFDIHKFPETFPYGTRI